MSAVWPADEVPPRQRVTHCGLIALHCTHLMHSVNCVMAILLEVFMLDKLAASKHGTSVKEDISLILAPELARKLALW